MRATRADDGSMGWLRETLVDRVRERITGPVEALKAVRRKRNLTVAQVAERMGMVPRTFEDFESGRGPVTHERIFAFAEATDSDPYAFILGATLGLPGFAIDCADTKLAFIFVTHLCEFARDEGEDITFLEPLHVIGGLERLFSDLGGKLSDQQAFLQKWMDKRTGSIGLDALRLRGVKRSPPKR